MKEAALAVALFVAGCGKRPAETSVAAGPEAARHGVTTYEVGDDGPRLELLARGADSATRRVTIDRNDRHAVTATDGASTLVVTPHGYRVGGTARPGTFVAILTDAAVLGTHPIVVEGRTRYLDCTLACAACSTCADEAEDGNGVQRCRACNACFECVRIGS